MIEFWFNKNSKIKFPSFDVKPLEDKFNSTILLLSFIESNKSSIPLSPKLFFDNINLEYLFLFFNNILLRITIELNPNLQSVKSIFLLTHLNLIKSENLLNNSSFNGIFKSWHFW